MVVDWTTFCGWSLDEFLSGCLSGCEKGEGRGRKEIEEAFL